jgi:hypothetical protein
VANTPAERSVPIVVLRQGEELALKVRTEQRPDTESTEIELDVYAIAETALPRPVRRISRRFSGRRDSQRTVRYVTRRP